MVSIPALIQTENARWNSVVIRSDKIQSFKNIAAKLVANKDAYLQVQALTNVPWFVVAVIHEREASRDFSRSLAQGDPWNRKSVHVPVGIGPFKSFNDAARYSLVNCPPKAGRWTDWSPGGTCVILVEYNGLGYANKGLPSPYVWAGTNQYIKGKYVRDGVFDPNAVDAQLGCAGLLIEMMKLDASIKFGAASVHQTTTISPSKKNVPVVHSPSIVPGAHPAPGSLGDMVGHFFHDIFSHLHF